MAYRLTLTKSERDAIDWIGGRYSNGDCLYRLLWIDSETIPPPHLTGDDDEVEWDGKYDLTFEVLPSIARRIRDNAESEDGHWPCFSDKLSAKMQHFIDSIV